MNDSGLILPITRAVLGIAFAYLIGSIPVGLIVGHVAKGIDIREHGSGNIGLTNVIRTLGWGPGLATGLLDFLKGYIPVLIALQTFSSDDFGGVTAIRELIIILVALCLILGNTFPVYLLFKGGKGVATGFGVISALIGVYIFIPLAIFGLILFLFRFVSLASISAAIAVPFTVLFLSNQLPFSQTDSGESTSAFALLLSFTSVVALLVIFKHTSNLKRIMKGEEPKIGRKGKSKFGDEPKPGSFIPEEKPSDESADSGGEENSS
ncbi:MAG TPA: glycerol-3-phosphate 1-O-acyltransferase [Firmicutes bacterium]|nr:glycerol-3-phosphate 1-O-acyltransferase [Bacillota bacterium]